MQNVGQVEKKNSVVLGIMVVKGRQGKPNGQMTSGNAANKTSAAWLGLHKNEDCGNRWLTLYWTPRAFSPWNMMMLKEFADNLCYSDIECKCIEQGQTFWGKGIPIGSRNCRWWVKRKRLSLILLAYVVWSFFDLLLSSFYCSVAFFLSYFLC